MEVPAKGGYCGPKCKARYILAIMSSVCMGLAYGLKVSLHVAIVAMVNTTATLQEHETSSHSPSKCGFDNAGKNATKPPQDGPFLWDNEIQGLLLGSYFFGYMVSLLPGGCISELYSAKWVLFFAIASNVVAMFLSPILSKVHYGGLLAMRVIQGIGGGVTFPANHNMISQWSPPLERSIMSSIVYAGTSLGTLIFMLISGLIADGLGWEAVFYIEGGFSTIWLVLWVCLIADSPKKQKLITQEERDYIVSRLESETGGGGRPPFPWRAVFTSSAFWAIFVAHVCSNWGFYLLLIELPTYLKQVLDFDISSNAVYTSIPFFTMWVFSLILSKILDTLREKKKITTTFARKLATLIASVIPMSCFIVLCFVECQRQLAVALMTIAVTSDGAMFSGFLSNHIDIAPNFAGTLVGLTNTIATIPGFVVPIIVGKLTHADPSIHSWRKVFYITIGLYCLEIVVYTIWGSGEVQEWNQGTKPKEEQPLTEK
ncbi:sialin [Tribolium madens]|uniref:sialin n=1 Tax=Tribolium madens TaxID=41895 RepID=UPI001CF725E9|nr:sialin [Tribolium madens]XP_044253826.1 sialin [Tribolium madens]